MIRFLEFAGACGAELTPAQATLARVLFDGEQIPGLPHGEAMFAYFGPVAEEQRRTVAIVAGARGGKTRMAALRLLHLALTCPLVLAPGEQASAIFVAPDLRLARQGLRYALGAAKHVPEIAALVQTEGADAFTLRRDDGQVVTLECLPASRGGSATRGRSLVGAVMDESAFFRDESSVVNDADVMKSIQPRLVPGGQLVIASTPWVEGGLLYDLWRRNFGRPADVLVAHAPTPLLRPDRPELYDGDTTDPTWRQEFGAEFGTTAGDLLLDPSTVDACTAAPRVDAKGYSAAVDLAFRSDSAALVVVGAGDDGFEVVEVLELRPSPGAPLVPSVVIDRFAQEIGRFGIRTVAADNHYLESAREHFGARGITVTPAPPNNDGKVETYLRTRAVIGEGRIRITNERLLAQLKGLRRRALPGGTIEITSPRRRGAGHGDLASALVLAVWNAKHSAYWSNLRTIGQNMKHPFFAR